jgi:hypothetical protein
MRNFSDLRHAQKSFNAVVEQHATPDDIYMAERAMLRETDARNGHRAYWTQLESLATTETTASAREAYAASLATSDELHAQESAEQGDDIDFDSGPLA